MTAADPINPLAVERIKTDDASLSANGWTIPPHFALGTALYEGGNCFEQRRQELASRPLLTDAAERVIESVRAEHRADFDVPISSIRAMGSDGSKLTLSTDDGLFGAEAPAFRKLANELASGFGPYAAHCVDEGATRLAAHDFNFWAARRSIADGEGGKTPGYEPNAVKLRVRTVDGARRLWACVSPSYGKLDADKFMAALEKAAPPGARAVVEYDGYDLVAHVFHLTPVELASEAGVGEVFQVGVVAGTSDDGTGRAWFSAFVERGVCRNFGTVTAKKDVGGRVHRGSEAQMAEAVAKLYAEAYGKVSVFADAWRDAAVDEIFGGNDDARSKLRKLIVEQGLIKVAGATREQVFQAVAAQAAKQPGASRQALWNWATAAAHEGRWTNRWAAQEIEEQATQLLYVRRLDV